MWNGRFSALVACCLATPAYSQPIAAAPYGQDSAPEWARARIAAGKVADFGLRCPAVKKIAVPDPCRTVTAGWLQDLVLSQASDGPRRVDIANAIVEGDIDLRDAEVKRELSILASLVDGSIDLSRARFASRLSLQGTTVVGALDGSSLYVGGDLDLEGATLAELKLNEAEVKGPVSLHDAAVTDTIAMPNAQIGADLNLSSAKLRGIDGNGIRVNGRIYAEDLKAVGMVSFGDASTRGDVWFEGGEIGEVLLDSAHVGSTLHMIGGVKFRGLFKLDGAMIDHYLDINGAEFAGGVSARAIHVGQEANVIGATVTDAFSLANAKLDGNLDLSNSMFDGDFSAAAARIGASLTADGTRWTRRPDMRFVHLPQDVDLSGARLPGLDLSGAEIGGLLLSRVADDSTQASLACWIAPPATAEGETARPASAREDCGSANGAWLQLRNAKAVSVSGAWSAWPEHVGLSGFVYSRIDVAPADPKAPEMTAAGWEAWLAKDKNFSPQHYLQLATALAADGNRDRALDIQYASREQERHAACRAGWDGKMTCVFLSVLSAVAGYGIGDYTWRAVYWVIGLTLVGAFFVWEARRVDSRNVFWPIGASLEKLLPYARFDRSFTEFFEKQQGFRLWHKIAFAILGLMGSVLGLFLAAAASGLTQKG